MRGAPTTDDVVEGSGIDVDVVVGAGNVTMDVVVAAVGGGVAVRPHAATISAARSPSTSRSSGNGFLFIGLICVGWAVAP